MKSELYRKKIRLLWARATAYANEVHQFASPLRKRETEVTINQMRRSATLVQLKICEALTHEDEAEISRALQEAREAATRVTECLYLCKNLKLGDEARVEELMKDCNGILSELSALLAVSFDTMTSVD